MGVDKTTAVILPTRQHLVLFERNEKTVGPDTANFGTAYLRYLLEMLTDTIQPHGKEIPFQTIDALGIHHPLIDMIQRAPVDRPHLDGQQIERRSLADPPDAGKQQAAERSHYHNVGNGVQRARIMPQIHAIASDATRRCIFSDA